MHTAVSPAQPSEVPRLRLASGCRSVLAPDVRHLRQAAADIETAVRRLVVADLMAESVPALPQDASPVAPPVALDSFLGPDELEIFAPVGECPPVVALQAHSC